MKYGWKPDVPDKRDLFFSTPFVGIELPTQIDLRPYCPDVYDQGELGSCTANALAGAYEFDLQKQSITPYVPSRLFIYYNERVIENTVDSDSGAQIRDGIKVISNVGAAIEDLWPYDITQFAVRPSAQVYLEAKQHKALSYQRISQNINDLKTCLASSYPFVFGFSVYDSFESQEVAANGIVPMPSASESMLGGHAVMCVGYDDAKKAFIVRNSWGDSWGDKGYFYLPYDYMTDDNLASDFWVVKIVQ